MMIRKFAVAKDEPVPSAETEASAAAACSRSDCWCLSSSMRDCRSLMFCSLAASSALSAGMVESKLLINNDLTIIHKTTDDRDRNETLSTSN